MESPINKPLTSNSKSRSELTKIRGIGAIRQQWLNALGLYTIADLARAAADEIESRLKQEGRSLPRQELEEWIAQAQAQLADHDSSSALSHRDSLPHGASASLNHAELGTAVKAEQPASITWRSLASFSIEYQTRPAKGRSDYRTIIHHLETGAFEQWAGLETLRLPQWILEQVEVSLAPTQIENAVIPNIIQLQVIQPPDNGVILIADQTHPIFPGVLQSNEPFVLEVSMQFTDLTSSDLRQSAVYRVQCVAHDLSNGATVVLGEVSASVPLSDQSTYKAWLSDLVLPHPGIYRLKVFVNLQNALATSGQFKVPMLQVV